MNISEATYREIERLLPVQRGNVKITNRRILEALIYICENGCKWRAVPSEYGKWHAIYVRINRWAKQGVLERVFTAMRDARLIGRVIEVVSLDSTAVKVHPDGMGAEKKRPTSDRQEQGRMDNEDPSDGEDQSRTDSIQHIGRECR
jgi:transposase